MNLQLNWILLGMAAVLLLACERERQQPAYEFTINSPAEIGSQYPNLYVDNSGLITMSWLLKIEEDMNSLQMTTYGERGWTPPRTVNISSDYFVNWADFPSVVSKDGEVVAAHWLRKIEGGPYAYNVNIVFPAEEARRWTAPITPHTDGTATEHGFVSMEPLDSDRVLAIWLDGRNTEGRGHHEYEDLEKAMTLRSAEVSRDGSLANELEVDPIICDCCSTDMVMADGHALAVYRDRTEDEIRDISIARYNLESGEWSAPVPVHEDGWQIMGCPVNGPRIDHNNGRTAVIWYTEGDGTPTVKLAVSEDEGETFGEPIVIAEENTLGRADVSIADDGTIYTSWLSSRDETGYVMMRTINPEMEMGNPIQVGVTTSTRRSGFPRIAVAPEGVLVAWTQTDPLIRVRTAMVRFDQIEEIRAAR